MTQYTLDDYQDSGFTDYKDESALRELYERREMTIGEVADHFDVAISTIYRWLMRNGIESRGKGSGKEPHVQFQTEKRLGYERWKDRDLGDHTTVRVHQLLAIAEGASPFDVFGGRNDIHHKNGIPWDNRPENIELLSSSEHISHHHRGSQNANSKLTEADVTNIRQRYNSGEGAASIATDYPVVEKSIERIARRKQWTHIE